jgi:predicted amidohydrolase YtcJ
VIHPDDAARLGKMNIIASMQPIHATSDMLMADAFWGERSRLAYAMKTQLDYGARLALGSDAPVESPNPFWGIHAAVTRRRADSSPSPEGWYPEQKLTMAQAVEGYTSLCRQYGKSPGSPCAKLSSGSHCPGKRPLHL